MAIGDGSGGLDICTSGRGPKSAWEGDGRVEGEGGATNCSGLGSDVVCGRAFVVIQHDIRRLCASERPPPHQPRHLGSWRRKASAPLTSRRLVAPKAPHQVCGSFVGLPFGTAFEALVAKSVATGTLSPSLPCSSLTPSPSRSTPLPFSSFFAAWASASPASFGTTAPS